MAMNNPAFSGPPPNPTFGVDLGEQMLRDGVEVPRLLEKCAEAIELHGLDNMGIYRLSGTTSKVQRLKQKLDYDLEGTDLLSEENLADINDTAAVLKLWFREMPEPLLTWELYYGFIEAASTSYPSPFLTPRSALTTPTSPAQRSRTTGCATSACTSGSTTCPTPTTRPYGS